jgi:hypothetical protein
VLAQRCMATGLRGRVSRAQDAITIKAARLTAAQPAAPASGFLIRDLAGVYGKQQTLAKALQRMRCIGCQGRTGAAWLEPGPGGNGSGGPSAWHSWGRMRWGDGDVSAAVSALVRAIKARHRPRLEAPYSRRIPPG